MTGLKLSHLVSGAIAVLLAYTSSAAIVFQAIDAVGATQAEANSWMLVLGLGMGISTLILTLRFKMPILTAWSTPGAALLGLSLTGVPMSEAVGAFVLCGLMLTLTGVTGWFERISHLIPASIGSAMLAGILFRFGLGVFSSMQENLPLVAVMCLTYLIGRRWIARFAIPTVLAIGVLFCALTGAFTIDAGFDLDLAMPVFTLPSFTLAGAVGIALPLYIVTMTSQNMPGVVTLKAAGYVPPVSQALTVTGLTSLILAPFGGFAFNLAAITAAICAGDEADENPATRWRAAAVTGVLYSLVGLMGAAVISLFLIAPKALVVTIAGLALLNTIAASLSAALAEPAERDAALVTFMTTVSGISFMSIGAPVWALLFGGLTAIVLRSRMPRKSVSD